LLIKRIDLRRHPNENVERPAKVDDCPAGLSWLITQSPYGYMIPVASLVLSSSPARTSTDNLDDTSADMSESKIEIQHLEQGETVKQETTHLEHSPETTTYEYADDHAPRVRLATWLVLLVRDRPG
jgi:hypothetical protein